MASERTASSRPDREFATRSVPPALSWHCSERRSRTLEKERKKKDSECDLGYQDGLARFICSRLSSLDQNLPERGTRYHQAFTPISMHLGAGQLSIVFVPCISVNAGVILCRGVGELSRRPSWKRWDIITVARKRQVFKELVANVKVVVSLSFETRGLPFSSVWGNLRWKASKWCFQRSTGMNPPPWISPESGFG